MKKYITVSLKNNPTAIVFTDHISVIQKSKRTGGAFIYFANESATLLTVDSFEDVCKKMGLNEKEPGKYSMD